MKNKKIIAIILSILLLIIDIVLYVKLKSTGLELRTSYEQYNTASLLIEELFRYGTLVWGILSVLIVWIEYFLINLLIKSYNKFNGFKRLFLCLITLVVIAIMLNFFIKSVLIILLGITS